MTDSILERRNFLKMGGAVAASTTVKITASYGTLSQSATLRVDPLLGAVTLNPASVCGGQSSTGTVMLNCPAPAGGSVITLSSANTAVATVPGSVTVPAV